LQAAGELSNDCFLRRGILDLRPLDSIGANTMTDLKAIVHSNPEVMSGTPVFVGTRVPVRNLIDYLEAGETLDEFLDDFPTVSRQQAISVLKFAADSLAEYACAA
jgi:uncharacterized protein (DUF433 family)